MILFAFITKVNMNQSSKHLTALFPVEMKVEGLITENEHLF